MAEMRDILSRAGVMRSIEVTKENAEDIAQMSGGVALYGDDKEVFAVRIPTLWGNVEAEVGDFVLQNRDTGRYVVQTPEEYRKAYFEQTPPELLEQIRNAPPPPTMADIAENVRENLNKSWHNPEFESEEDLQAHTSRNLFEERQRKLYGRTADND